MLYFAYGSNLDLENWDLWCANKRYDAASIEPLGPAWLPDHELVFHYQSRLRKGGALDVRPRLGTVIPGALFRVHDWEGLDAKEGVSGRYYRRISVTALTDDGRAHPAATYCVCDERVGPFVPPSPAYCEIVTSGLSRFGHRHDAFLEAASDTHASPSPTAIFTYGTLMSGERNHDLLAPQVIHSHGSARVSDAVLVLYRLVSRARTQRRQNRARRALRDRRRCRGTPRARLLRGLHGLREHGLAVSTFPHQRSDS